MATDDTGDAIRQAADRIAAAGESRPRAASDPVNLPMIRHWTQALGDASPVYTDATAAAASVHGGLVAPPAMVQVWTMRGLSTDAEDTGDPLGLMTAVLDDAGFTSVVATNCEQEYLLELRPGDQLSLSTVIEDISEEKRTSLGAGHFVTSLMEYRDQHGELVGTQRWRILKFKPPER